MIKPAKNKLYIGFLNLYFRFILKLQFRDLIIKQFPSDLRTKPTLVIGNHFSWWDGIIINELNRKFFKKDFYVIMLEEQLRKNMILTKAGAFSINRNSRDMINSFNYCKELLKVKETLLLFYPQGSIESIHINKVNFMKGLERLLHENLNLVFYVCLPDYFSNSKPDLTFYFEEFKGDYKNARIEEIEKAYNQFYNLCKEQQCS